MYTLRPIFGTVTCERIMTKKLRQTFETKVGYLKETKKIKHKTKQKPKNFKNNVCPLNIKYDFFFKNGFNFLFKIKHLLN